MIKNDKELFANIDRNLLLRFKAYHLENPNVFKSFLAASQEMRRAGRRKYSAWAIVNKIRWDFDISTKDKVFKINNESIALYARLVIYHHPEFCDFFEMRKMKPSDRSEGSEEKYRASKL